MHTFCGDFNHLMFISLIALRYILFQREIVNNNLFFVIHLFSVYEIYIDNQLLYHASLHSTYRNYN